MLRTLVNIQKTIENHHFSWENPLFRWGITGITPRNTGKSPISEPSAPGIFGAFSEAGERPLRADPGGTAAR